MILPFMTHWGKDMPPRMAGKPTYFVEKIIEGLDVSNIKKHTLNDLYAEVAQPSDAEFICGLWNENV